MCGPHYLNFVQVIKCIDQQVTLDFQHCVTYNPTISVLLMISQDNHINILVRLLCDCLHEEKGGDGTDCELNLLHSYGFIYELKILCVMGKVNS